MSKIPSEKRVAVKKFESGKIMKQPSVALKHFSLLQLSLTRSDQKFYNKPHKKLRTKNVSSAQNGSNSKVNLFHATAYSNKTFICLFELATTMPWTKSKFLLALDLTPAD